MVSGCIACVLSVISHVSNKAQFARRLSILRILCHESLPRGAGGEAARQVVEDCKELVKGRARQSGDGGLGEPLPEILEPWDQIPALIGERDDVGPAVMQ